MPGRTKNQLAIISWVLYDFANTIYSMNVVSMYFSLWITVNLARQDLWVSFGNSFSMALVAFSLPILGAFSDYKGYRIPYLRGFTLTAVLATMSIGMVGYCLPINGIQVIVAVLFFIIANYAYQGALVFYNALLPVVSPAEKMGKISGYGVGVGYMGSIFGLLMVMPLVQGGISFFDLNVSPLQEKWQTIKTIEKPDIPPEHRITFLDTTITTNDNYEYRLVLPDTNQSKHHEKIEISSKDTIVTKNQHKRRAIVVRSEEIDSPISAYILQRRISGWGRVGAFIPTAILFFFFAIPVFIFVKEPKRSFHDQSKPELKKAFRDVWESLRNTRKYPGVLRFLIAKFFYEEGIQTAIIFMAIFAVKVIGLPNEMIILFFMVTTSAAVVGSILFGFITDKLSPKPTLIIVISSWVVCLIAIAFVKETILFWIIGGLIGIFMGSTWTSARPLLISLVPKEKLAEFFGLYAFSGKAAAIIGPMIWGITVALLAPYGVAIKYRGAVLSLALLMLIGLVILLKVPSKKMKDMEMK